MELELMTRLLLLHQYIGQITQYGDGENTDRANYDLHSETSFAVSLYHAGHKRALRVAEPILKSDKARLALMQS